LATATPAKAPTPVGVWQDSSGRVRVEIAPCADQLCGKVVWFKKPNDAKGAPLVDLRNTDPALRQRGLMGLAILYGLHRTGERTWDDGKLYNPDDGLNYQARLSIDPNGDLRLRAYVLIPLLGKTRVFTRIR
jgi:uncharacterized protein (DUF2147 family)